MLAAAAMGLIASLKRLVAGSPPAAVERLYAAVVAAARQPHWYQDGDVPDTLDGRFDMVVLVLALLMLRLEDLTAGNPRHPAAQLSANLADRFLADMEGNLRQDGVGDQVIPKHMGRMMAALGGRLGAYRDAHSDGAALADALRRNLYRGEAVTEAAVDSVAAAVLRLQNQLAATSAAALLAGQWPQTA